MSGAFATFEAYGIRQPYIDGIGIPYPEYVISAWVVKSSDGGYFHAVTDAKKHYIWGPSNTQWEFVEIFP